MANLCPWKREVNSGIVTGGKGARKYLAIWRGVVVVGEITGKTLFLTVFVWLAWVLREVLPASLTGDSPSPR